MRARRRARTALNGESAASSLDLDRVNACRAVITADRSALDDSIKDSPAPLEVDPPTGCRLNAWDAGIAAPGTYTNTQSRGPRAPPRSAYTPDLRRSLHGYT